SPALMAHDFRSWDTGQKVLLPVLVPSVSRGGGQHGHLFKLPGECGGIFRAVIIKKIVRKILVRKILVRKILGHLIAVAAPETVLYLLQIQSGTTPCLPPTPILLHRSILYLGSCLTTCSMRLVRIVEVRIIKTPKRRAYPT